LTLQRFIAAIIILSLVGLPAAWAFDAHSAHVGDPRPASDAAVPSSSVGQDQGHEHDAGHCCHAGAHLVGLGSVWHPPLFPSAALPRLAALPDPYLSRTTAPPLKPPQT